jgi:hypothetical protein
MASKPGSRLPHQPQGHRPREPETTNKYQKSLSASASLNFSYFFLTLILTALAAAKGIYMGKEDTQKHGKNSTRPLTGPADRPTAVASALLSSAVLASESG